MLPTLALPVPFCRQGLRPEPLTSARVLWQRSPSHFGLVFDDRLIEEVLLHRVRQELGREVEFAGDLAALVKDLDFCHFSLSSASQDDLTSNPSFLMRR